MGTTVAAVLPVKILKRVLLVTSSIVVTAYWSNVELWIEIGRNVQEATNSPRCVKIELESKMSSKEVESKQIITRLEEQCRVAEAKIQELERAEHREASLVVFQLLTHPRMIKGG